MKVWLIGSGSMSLSYAQVLRALDVQVQVVGRGQVSAAAFKEATGLRVQTGGLDAYLSTKPALPDAAIVSVGVEALHETTAALLKAGVRRILVEKPGALYLPALLSLRELAVVVGAQVYIGYNRRYFASTAKVRELLAEDGGATSCTFEFTEWGHEIETLTKGAGVKERWLLSNSTHVIDLAFHLIGLPASLHATTRGSLPWHPSGSVFVGAGVSERGVPFSYHSNWDAPGRWGVEVLTKHRRLILRPMEAVQVMRKGSVAIESLPIDDALDKTFKPGLHRQVSEFLSTSSGILATLDEQIRAWPVHCQIGNYEP